MTQLNPVHSIGAMNEQRWELNGVLHREDGPALIRRNGDKYWFFNGKKHRTDGPAVEFSESEPLFIWYLDGDAYFFEDWLELTPLSNKEKLKLRLKYAE